MTQLTERAMQLLEILEPTLKRKYINGSWKYETTYGAKTREGLLNIIIDVMQGGETA